MRAWDDSRVDGFTLMSQSATAREWPPTHIDPSNLQDEGLYTRYDGSVARLVDNVLGRIGAGLEWSIQLIFCAVADSVRLGLGQVEGMCLSVPPTKGSEAQHRSSTEIDARKRRDNRLSALVRLLDK